MCLPWSLICPGLTWCHLSYHIALETLSAWVDILSKDCMWFFRRKEMWVFLANQRFYVQNNENSRFPNMDFDLHLVTYIILLDSSLSIFTHACLPGWVITWMEGVTEATDIVKHVPTFHAYFVPPRAAWSLIYIFFWVTCCIFFLLGLYIRLKMSKYRTKTQLCRNIILRDNLSFYSEVTFNSLQRMYHCSPQLKTFSFYSKRKSTLCS